MDPAGWGRGEFEGSGIGLAICRKIVERHGGQISAQSQPGEGTTFIVALPITQPGLVK
jgi:signal transduction histidine kinase